MVKFYNSKTVKSIRMFFSGRDAKKDPGEPPNWNVLCAGSCSENIVDNSNVSPIESSLPGAVGVPSEKPSSPHTSRGVHFNQLTNSEGYSESSQEIRASFDTLAGELISSTYLPITGALRHSETSQSFDALVLSPFPERRVSSSILEALTVGNASSLSGEGTTKMFPSSFSFSSSRNRATTLPYRFQEAKSEETENLDMGLVYAISPPTIGLPTTPRNSESLRRFNEEVARGFSWAENPLTVEQTFAAASPSGSASAPPPLETSFHVTPPASSEPDRRVLSSNVPSRWSDRSQTPRRGLFFMDTSALTKTGCMSVTLGAVTEDEDSSTKVTSPVVDSGLLSAAVTPAEAAAAVMRDMPWFDMQSVGPTLRETEREGEESKREDDGDSGGGKRWGNEGDGRRQEEQSVRPFEGIYGRQTNPSNDYTFSHILLVIRLTDIVLLLYLASEATTEFVTAADWDVDVIIRVFATLFFASCLVMVDLRELNCLWVNRQSHGKVAEFLENIIDDHNLFYRFVLGLLCYASRKACCTTAAPTVLMFASFTVLQYVLRVLFPSFYHAECGLLASDLGIACEAHSNGMGGEGESEGEEKLYNLREFGAFLLDNKWVSHVLGPVEFLLALLSSLTLALIAAFAVADFLKQLWDRELTMAPLPALFIFSWSTLLLYRDQIWFNSWNLLKEATGVAVVKAVGTKDGHFDLFNAFCQITMSMVCTTIDGKKGIAAGFALATLTTAHAAASYTLLHFEEDKKKGNRATSTSGDADGKNDAQLTTAANHHKNVRGDDAAMVEDPTAA